jgi:hypothetical protein
MRRLMALLLALAAGCGGSDAPTAAPGEWKGLADALRGASPAEAWRIAGGGGIQTPTPPGTPPEPRKGYLESRELSGPVLLSDSQRKTLTKILSDPASITDGVHPCIPSPGIKVRYTRQGREPVWVLFCFECHEVFVYEGSLQREHKGFDNAVAALSRVMKEIFPQDEVIQHLK